MNLPDLLGKVKIDVSQAKAALNDIKGEAGGAAGAFGNFGKLAQTAGITLGGMAAGAAAAALAIKGLVIGYADAAGTLTDLNRQLSIGVVEIQKIQYAAKMSGVEFSKVTTSIMQMEKAASKTPEKFEQLGISFGKLRTSKPDELLMLISDGLKGVADQNERARIAQEIFGKGGSAMLKMLLDDYRGLNDEATKTGLLSEQMVAKGDKISDSFDKLGDVFEKLKLNLGAAFANPAILKGMELMTSLIGAMARNADRLVTGLTDSMPGIGLLVRGYNAFAGDSAAAGSPATGGGVSNIRQYTIGKGGESMPKALSDLDRAFDKLARRMDNDAVKAAEKAERAEVKLARSRQKAIEDFKESWSPSNIPDGFVGPENPYELKIPKGNKGFALWNDPSKFEVGDGPRSIHIETQYDAAIAKQEKAAETAARWAGALQGVALLAGAIGGKFGDTIGVMGNIAKSFEGWGGKGFNKFNAIAGGVGQIGGLVGGRAGGALQGAAGGAMTGASLGSIIPGVGTLAGGVIGGAIGLFGGLFGGGRQKEEERKAREAQKLLDEQNRIAEEREKRISGVANFSGGMNQFYSGGGISDQASADRAGRFAMFSFGQQVKESGDIFGALDSIGPTLEKMAESAEKFGLEMPAGVQSLLQLNGLDDGIKSMVSGLNMMTKGIGESGLSTQALFSDLGAEAVATRAKLEETGLSGAQSMAIMQPSLQQLYEMQKLHGYAVDETTQALLDEAKAQGVVGDQFMSANERMVELLGILIETIGGKLPESYKRAGDAAEEYGRRAANSIPSGYHATPGLDEPSGDEGGPGFASGTGFRDFGAGTRVTLHGREAVMTEPQVDRLVSMAVSGAAGSTVPMGGNGGGRPIVVNVMLPDGRVLTTAVTNTLLADGIEAQNFRQAASGVR